MNKYQEALNELKEWALKGSTPIGADKFHVAQQIARLQELVDKAEHIKPISKVLQATSDKGRSIRIRICGSCESALPYSDYHCANCGQAIDWNKDE